MLVQDILTGVYQANPNCTGEIKQDIYGELIRKILPVCTGDILEIGAFDGRSTRVFAEIGKTFDRQVYVVDPWDGHQEGNEKVYKEFIKNTAHLSNIHVLRVSSQDKSAIDYISKLSLCFCLIDGLHTKDAVTQDILAVQSASFGKGIIMVDDVRDLYGCLGAKTCQDIMDSVNYHQNDKWKHILSPSEWLGTCYVKEI